MHASPKYLDISGYSGELLIVALWYLTLVSYTQTYQSKWLFYAVNILSVNFPVNAKPRTCTSVKYNFNTLSTAALCANTSFLRLNILIVGSNGAIHFRFFRFKKKNIDSNLTLCLATCYPGSLMSIRNCWSLELTEKQENRTNVKWETNDVPEVARKCVYKVFL